MPFKKLTHWLRETSKTPRRLGVDQLEDRMTPSANLVDVNSAFSGAANRPSTILGQSDDGRYIIFRSAATDVIPGQQDIPDTDDLFWKDLVTGQARMVTALPLGTNGGTYDYSSTQSVPISFSLTAVIDGPPIRQSFQKAVISGDGRSVAFTSVVNASRVDQDFANKVYLPSSNDTNTYDLTNTLDAFRWDSRTGVIGLASRTVASADTKGLVTALGLFGSSDNPAISSDGTYVGFTSNVDAYYTSDIGRPVQVKNNEIVDGGNTSDAFVTSFDKSLATPTVRCISMKETTITIRDAAQLPLFVPIQYQVFRTFGHMAGSDGVSVDANGNWLANDLAGAVSAVGVASVNPSLPLDTGITTLNRDDQNLALITQSIGKLRVVTPANVSAREAYRFNLPASLQNDIDVNLITLTGQIGINPSGVTSSNTNPGNAQNIKISSRNPNSMLVSTSSGVTGNGYVTSTSQELYYVSYNINPVATKVNTGTLPTTAANATIADTTQYGISPNGKHLVYSQIQLVGGVQTSQVFYRASMPSLTAPTLISAGTDGNPLATGATSPHVSQNGRYVTFLSTTPASAVANPAITDKNGVNDAFLRDLYFSTGGGPITPTTFTLSVDSTGLRTANGVASNVLVGTSNEDPVNGISPTQVNDSLGRAIFNDTATNISLGFIPTHGGTSIYVQTLPIGGVPPAVPPTTAPRKTTVSGGREAGILQVNFNGDGLVTFGDRLTPYPGYFGEIRVANGDFNGDGITDIAVAPGKGVGPRVIVYNGATGARFDTIPDFFAYESFFTGGVNLAAGDFNGDGKDELVTGADAGGGARVKVIDLNNGNKALVDFFAYDSSFRGGVRVAVGDFNGKEVTGPLTGQSIPDLLTGAGTGGGPRVSAFNGVGIRNGNLDRFIDFFAMELNLRNGVFVAAGDMNNDGRDDIVVGAGAGGGPRVSVFESSSVIARPSSPDKLYDFFAGNVNSRAGIRVGVNNVNGDAFTDIVTGEGFGRESRIRTFAGSASTATLTPSEIDNSFVVFNDLTSFNGAWVG